MLAVSDGAAEPEKAIEWGREMPDTRSLRPHMCVCVCVCFVAAAPTAWNSTTLSSAVNHIGAAPECQILGSLSPDENQCGEQDH